jgi:hypothetical protein
MDAQMQMILADARIAQLEASLRSMAAEVAQLKNAAARSNAVLASDIHESILMTKADLCKFETRLKLWVAVIYVAAITTTTMIQLALFIASKH